MFLRQEFFFLFVPLTVHTVFIQKKREKSCNSPPPKPYNNTTRLLPSGHWRNNESSSSWKYMTASRSCPARPSQTFTTKRCLMFYTIPGLLPLLKNALISCFKLSRKLSLKKTPSKMQLSLANISIKFVINSNSRRELKKLSQFTDS